MINGRVLICVSPQAWNSIKAVFHAERVEFLRPDRRGHGERCDEWAILDLQRRSFKGFGEAKIHEWARQTKERDTPDLAYDAASPRGVREDRSECTFYLAQSTLKCSRKYLNPVERPLGSEVVLSHIHGAATYHICDQ